jgi:hypothetical protein
LNKKKRKKGKNIFYILAFEKKILVLAFSLKKNFACIVGLNDKFIKSIKT